MLADLIVVTDLDGTLLDHRTYQYTEALPALRRLGERGVPVILNSSKTAAEMRELRKELENRHPFIVENGAGIHIPDRGDDRERSSNKVSPGVGMERAEILRVLEQLRKSDGYRFTGFADMTAEDLSARAGLSLEQAARALERDFTEPLVWEDSRERFTGFCAALEENGIRVVTGGRFVHLSAPVDKGMAVEWLKKYYARLWGKPPMVIALGDSDNDRAMLERADYPVLVRSPVNRMPAINHPHLIRTDEVGPAGWNRAVLALLESLPG